jgi:ADP-ribose pyrophosphatase YjhB (NUDIX family)
MTNKLLDELKRLKSIADIGHLYASNEYEKERYIELQDITVKLLHLISDHSIGSLKETFPLAESYPTAKVDIRGLILSDDHRILLVKESADKRWSLPGGWADIGYTPKEVIIKECKEETGLDVVPQQLLAVFDKRMHAHPPQPHYVYKMVFYCKAVSYEITKGFDVLDVQYFDVDNLPELSEDRILVSQIEMLYRKVTSPNLETYFD